MKPDSGKSADWSMVPQVQRISWAQECRAAATDDAVFRTFRQLPTIMHMTENRSAAHAVRFWEAAQHIWPVAEYLPALVAADAIGGPPPERSMRFPNGQELSGTTAASALMAAQIIRLFGKGPFQIAEIGGGYGNLAHVLHLMGMVDTYTGFDLPEPSALRRRFLKAQGWPEPVAPKKRYDLCISAASLSELTPEARREYGEHVLAKSDRGFHVWNWGVDEWSGLVADTLRELQEWNAGAKYCPDIQAASDRATLLGGGTGVWDGTFCWGM